jgi:hypothetical protein
MVAVAVTVTACASGDIFCLLPVSFDFLWHFASVSFYKPCVYLNFNILISIYHRLFLPPSFHLLIHNAARHGYFNMSSGWSEPPWSGWIETTGDALLILEAARRGMIPRVTRRLVDNERKMITSGSVFVFDEDESGIKRWTDGFFWSPSRILGNFLLYRETDKRGVSHKTRSSDVAEGDKGESQSLSRPKNEMHLLGHERLRERTLVGSLTNAYKFKPDGLMKKVRGPYSRISMTIPTIVFTDLLSHHRRRFTALNIIL